MDLALDMDEALAHPLLGPHWQSTEILTSMRAGDDAVDLALDTDEVLAHPLLGPLTRSAVRALAPGMDPAEVTPPIGKDPLLGLPTIVPLPRLERIYFKCAWFLVTFCSQVPGQRHVIMQVFGRKGISGN